MDHDLAAAFVAAADEDGWRLYEPDILRTPPVTVFAQVHVGDPGPKGDGRWAATLTRARLTIVRRGDRLVSTTDAVWVAEAAERWEWVSLWGSDSDAGEWDPLLAVPLDEPVRVRPGDRFTVRAGQLGRIVG